MTVQIIDPLPSEKEALKLLVERVALAQGNIFIKELLRSRGIRIGKTKAEFKANMIAAIEKGDLRRQHVEAWLREVEGWGNQHIYLFKVSRAVRVDPVWSDQTMLEEKIRKAGFAKEWRAEASLEYPPAQTLTGIYFDNGVLTLVWHKGVGGWVRDERRDFEQEIEGELYKFKASRQRGERIVTRFVMRPFDGVAASFVQIPFEEEEHQTALDTIISTVNRLWPFAEFEPLPMSKAIKKLDSKSLDKDGITAHQTRFGSGESYMQFGTRSAQLGYQDSTSIRGARLAVDTKNLSGEIGNFGVPRSQGELKRKARVQMFNKKRRIKIASQMSAAEVWGVLGLITESA